MQSESGARDAVSASPAQRVVRVEDLLQPFSEGDVTDLAPPEDALREYLDAPGGWAAHPASLASLQRPPSTFPPGSSSHDDLDSLVRHTARHAELLMALRDATSRLTRRFSKFAPLRADVLLRRHRLQHEWKQCADQRRFVSDSHDAFLREATMMCDNVHSGVSTERLAMLLEQVSEDHKRQAEHLVKTYNSETELGDAEFDLQKREYQLAKAAQDVVDVINQMELPSPAGAPPSTSASEVVQDEIPALVENYFEKAGDVRLAQDSIMELRMEYREEREKRIFQQDQDIELPISDEEFDEMYNKQLADAEIVLAEATRKSENAKQVCHDSNLDPELYRIPKLDPALAEDRSISDQDALERLESEMHESPRPVPTITPDGLPSPLAQPFANAGDEHTIKESLFPGISEPIQIHAPASSLSQGLSSSRRHDTAAPLGDRIRGWMDNVTVEGGIANPAFLSRSKSTEQKSSHLVLEERQDGTWGINKAASNSLREQHRQESLHDNDATSLRRYTEDGRPILVKRSSSESKVLVLPELRGSYQDAMDSIRNLQAARP